MIKTLHGKIRGRTMELDEDLRARTDLLAAWQEGLMRTVVEHLPDALADPRHRRAREELMWCATCAINGWASPGDPWTPMHQIGHVLTARH